MTFNFFKKKKELKSEGALECSRCNFRSDSNLDFGEIRIEYISPRFKTYTKYLCHNCLRSIWYICENPEQSDVLYRGGYEDALVETKKSIDTLLTKNGLEFEEDLKKFKFKWAKYIDRLLS